MSMILLRSSSTIPFSGADRLDERLGAVDELGTESFALDGLVEHLHRRFPVAPGEVEAASVLLVEEAFVVGLVYDAQHRGELAHLDA